jgi:hypothetical protein
MGINYAQLKKSKNPIIGIGCTEIKNYILKNVLVIFHISQNTFHIERLPIITVLKHEPKNAQERELVDQIPSLLGIDILEKYSVRFTAKKVILEQ